MPTRPASAAVVAAAARCKLGKQRRRRPCATLCMAAGYDAGADAVEPPYREFDAKTAKFWSDQLADGKWYKKAEQWWVDNCPPTVNGVLGGFAELDLPDVKDSTMLLNHARENLKGKGNEPMRWERCLDGGAGIGRVTKNLLSNFFEKVDLVEGNQRLLDTVPEFLGSEPGKRERLGELFCSTLQDFCPAEGQYDCIWIQWVVIYLTDADFVKLLRRCIRGLRPGGMIFIKENVLTAGSSDLLKDEDDSSVSRSNRLMRHIFLQADLEIVEEKTQTDWPSGMFPVMMYAMRPKISASQ